MENDFQYNNFSKMMGEGSDIDDESDDDMDALLDSMSENQSIDDAGMSKKSISLDSNLISQSMMKLVRTIEEQIDGETSGLEMNVHDQMCPPTSQNNTDTPVSQCDDFSGDPSVIYESYSIKLTDDIEQGLKYLYAKVKNDNTVLTADSNYDHIQMQRNNHYSNVFNPEAQMTDHEHYEVELKSQQSFDQQSLSDSPDLCPSEIEDPLCTSKSNIKKRLGKKEEVLLEIYECVECKKEFPTIRQLQQHFSDAHEQKRKKFDKNLEFVKNSRNMRDISPQEDWSGKKMRFSSEKLDLPLEKKVICQHCKMKFFNLEDLLCHLRAEHSNRKKNLEDYKTKYTRTNRESDLSSRQKIRKKLEMSDLKMSGKVSKNTPKCSHCAKIFYKPAELENHLRVIHEEVSICDIHSYICKHCEETFLTKYDFIKHTERKHYIKKIMNRSKTQNSTPREFVCRVCHVDFFKIYNLKKHLNIAHKT